MKTFSHLWQYLAELFLEWEMFDIKVVEKIKRHILCSATFSRKSCPLWDNVEKAGGSRDATDTMAHARCMLGLHTPTFPGTHTHARTHNNM
jgi:hypothetical protein